MALTKNLVLASVATLALAATAQATVTYSVRHKGANNELGNLINPVNTGGTFALVFDLDNDGWDGQSYTAPTMDAPFNSFLWDAQDAVIGTTGFGGSSATQIEAFPTINVLALSGYTPGVTNIYGLFFNKPFVASDTAPSDDGLLPVYYTAVFLGKAIADGGNLQFRLDNITARPQTTFKTALVPEPTSALLLLAGSGLLLARRRQAK
ncbi:MAG: PEP-CTERM sorting domain-containing protein [Phycisphaerales bacterium]|nr:PEP-CTERM sorting domain-containing protein [Phycisphaerales bacterium]